MTDVNGTAREIVDWFWLTEPADTDALERRIAAALVKEREEAALANDGWRDMESAPRDGTVILLATPQNKCFPGPVCGLWHEGDWHFVEDAEDMNSGGNSWVDGYGPTLWMPLPQPPEPSHD